MGHFYVDGRRHQITDTPGLLNREDVERNKLELLTLATLRYLPTAVVFVLDATGECGMELSDQMKIRSNLRAAFESKRWIDVFSKSDLLTRSSALGQLEDAIRVSCRSDRGVEDLKERMMELFRDEM